MSPSTALDASNPQMNGTSGVGPPAEQREQEVETALPGLNLRNFRRPAEDVKKMVATQMWMRGRDHPQRPQLDLQGHRQCRWSLEKTLSCFRGQGLAWI